MKRNSKPSAQYETAPQFSERERAALAYGEAVAMANTVAPDLFERVRRSFNEDEIIELTATVTWEICAAKFNRALEIEGQGICVLPNFGTKRTDRT